ncbi:MAG: adenylate/guanylate cyclase domain-containing protein, partial [Thermoleophilia bacterium]|nr:adenylate/guanylate cyclase domain-containing protein [Thermoleophilia bacterium]
IWGITDDASSTWWQSQAPYMRYYVGPDDPHFDEVFGPLAEMATRLEPVEPPRAIYHRSDFRPDSELKRTLLGDANFLDMSINDSDGRFIGILRLVKPAMPESLLARLGRGDMGLFERMERVREPARRQAAILFADLEASGIHSRRLSSRGYFRLIGDITDLIDSAVVDRTGIVGKHAGDGGSALFLTGDFNGSDSAAARAAIETAREIQAGAAELDSENEIRVNVGLHWGSTLMVGQVATRGRLEVTALGDQMNECARIEAVAATGSILASKELIERLEPEAAEAVGVDIEEVSYVPLAEIEGAEGKAVRDAGTIPVAWI